MAGPIEETGDWSRGLCQARAIAASRPTAAADCRLAAARAARKVHHEPIRQLPQQRQGSGKEACDVHREPMKQLPQQLAAWPIGQPLSAQQLAAGHVLVAFDLQGTQLVDACYRSARLAIKAARANIPWVRRDCCGGGRDRASTTPPPLTTPPPSPPFPALPSSSRRLVGQPAVPPARTARASCPPTGPVLRRDKKRELRELAAQLVDPPDAERRLGLEGGAGRGCKLQQQRCGRQLLQLLQLLLLLSMSVSLLHCRCRQFRCTTRTRAAAAGRRAGRQGGTEAAAGGRQRTRSGAEST